MWKQRTVKDVGVLKVKCVIFASLVTHHLNIQSTALQNTVNRPKCYVID